MVDCCSAPGLMPIEQAQQHLLDSINVLTETETINIERACGRILSQTISSTLNVPAFNNSAMDGYAIRDDQLNDSASEQKQFTQIGTALAGQPFIGQLENHQCIRIMTGAVVPESANAVVMQENTQVDGSQVQLTEPAKLNSHVRLAGEDIQQGQQIFSANYKLKTVDIGLLASLGVSQVQVFRPLKVALLSTGDELKTPGQPLALGDIYETNRYVLRTMLNKLNIEIIDLGIIKDNKDDIRAAFQQADQQADVVISSGGVSVGDADYVKEILTELGQINFWKVAIKPGKPFAFGQLPNSVFFGLPGNPVSATVTFHQLALPALEKMSGNQATQQLLLTAICQNQIRKRAGRADYQRGIAAINQQGQLVVNALDKQGSAILTSISHANCYIVLPREHQGCPVGEQVKVLLFDHLLN